MDIIVESTHLGDVVVLVPEVFSDNRGDFIETYRQDTWQALGLLHTFVQDNHSRSVRGVIRGLHFQWNPPMGKLMRVTTGRALLVAVDIRKNSPTLGRWVGTMCSAENRRQVWAPAGFARGFCVLSEVAEVQYKCTGIYNSAGESAIRWDDPAIGIEWPDLDFIISDKDRKARTLAAWLASPESAGLAYGKRSEAVILERTGT